MSAVLAATSTPVAAAADQPLLRLQNVESAYGPIKAIRGVSLQVRRGEIAAVLGSNGAGKTTILKTISGIIDPRKGSIEFAGADITANDPAAIVRRGLMHVPEGREVFPLLSVRDNLLMGAYTRADKDAVARDIETVFGYFPILKERERQEVPALDLADRFNVHKGWSATASVSLKPTVLSGGLECAASSTLSKPMSAKSSPARRPCSPSAVSAPKATMSL